MSKKNKQFNNKKSDASINMALPPPEEWEDPNNPPTGGYLSLNQVSPIAGALAGGITITLLGNRVSARSRRLFRKYARDKHNI